MTKIETFNDLQVWQKAHELVLCIYQITCRLDKKPKKFPIAYWLTNL